MKKFLFIAGLALTFVCCNTPQPTGSPDGTDTTMMAAPTTDTMMSPDTSKMRDTSNMR